MLTEEQIYKTAYYQLAKHGLLDKDWECTIDGRLKRGWAETDWYINKIRISLACKGLKLDAFRKLIYHEVAHALLPLGIPVHGKRWKNLCKKLGGTGSPLYSTKKRFKKCLNKTTS